MEYEWLWVIISDTLRMLGVVFIVVVVGYFTTYRKRLRRIKTRDRLDDYLDMQGWTW